MPKHAKPAAPSSFADSWAAFRLANSEPEPATATAIGWRAHVAAANGDIAACRRFCEQDPALLGTATHSLLDEALKHGRVALAVELIGRGAWSSDKNLFKTHADKTPFAESLGCLWNALATHLADPAALGLADAALAASGRPTPGWEGWVGLKIAQDRHAEAFDLCAVHGLSPSVDDVRKACARAMQHPFAGPRHSQAGGPPEPPCRGGGFWHALCVPDPGGRNHESILALLEAAPPASLPVDFVDYAWSRLAKLPSAPAIDRLVAAGHLPSSWALPREGQPVFPGTSRRVEKHEDFGSLAAAAFCHGNAGLGRALMAMPEARQAALDFPPAVETLSVAIATLQAMAKSGISIRAKNAAGENLLHHWAALDTDVPRDGWRTVANLFPDAPFDLDAKGRSALDAQRSHIPKTSKRLDAFNRMAAGLERKEISAATAPADSPRAPRSRL